MTRILDSYRLQPQWFPTQQEDKEEWENPRYPTQRSKERREEAKKGRAQGDIVRKHL